MNFYVFIYTVHKIFLKAKIRYKDHKFMRFKNASSMLYISSYGTISSKLGELCEVYAKAP